MRLTFLKTVMALAFLALNAGAAGAADVYLDLDASGKGQYTIEARFWTPGNLTETWGVLTDYEHLPFFIPSLKKSQIVQRAPDHLLLEQEAVGRAMLFFHRQLFVRLQVRERHEQQILFEDLSHHDFASYSGSWHIEQASGGGSWVSYHLQAEPNFYAPASVARASFRKMAKELLLSVQTEILRRGRLNDTLLCCSQR